MLRRALQLILILVLLIVVWEAVMFVRVSRLATVDPTTTAFMEQRKDELRDAGESDEIAYRFVPYESISPNLRSAVLVSEDSKFFDHEGLDTEQLEKLLKEAWEKKELGRGGSTITQQLAKNLYLSPSRNPIRKLRELTITKYLEWRLSKKRILELYLNVVEMGERVYGAEAAAQHYFGVRAANLTPGQAALLAGALPNPRKANPGNPGPWLRSRRDIIVSRMQRWGYEMDRQIVSSSAEKEAEREPEPELPNGEEVDAEGDGEPDALEISSPNGEEPGATGPMENPNGPDEAPTEEEPELDPSGTESEEGPN